MSLSLNLLYKNIIIYENIMNINIINIKILILIMNIININILLYTKLYKNIIIYKNTSFLVHFMHLTIIVNNNVFRIFQRCFYTF